MRAVTLAGWALLLAGIVIAEAAGRRGLGVPAVAVLRAVLRSPAIQVLAAMFWLWLGWHVFVRASRG